jgi:2-iminobutanoate/2-iminopropanoate deaminase
VEANSLNQGYTTVEVGVFVAFAMMSYNEDTTMEGMAMAREIVATDKAPAAVGPYSQAVRVGDLIYTAGQLGLVPGTKDFAGQDIEAQTRQALENVCAVLEEAGSCAKHVVKTTVFLLDMAEFSRMNAVYAEFFPEDPPARSAVQAAALPLGGRVEIEAVAELCDCSSEGECGCDCH